MNIIWFSWKDTGHPEAGGAESVSNKLMRSLVDDGHSVTLITALYDGASDDEVVDGIRILRCGGKFSVYPLARRVYKKNFSSKTVDLVIDEMNTVPFFAGYFTNTKTVLLTYQLARKVWFYQMVFPLSIIGYLIEPLYLRLICKKYSIILTESQSTKNDLIRYGFSGSKIHVFRVNINTKPLKSLPAKQNLNKVLFLGAFRPMKRPIDAIKAFEFARDRNPSLILRMAGSNSSAYGQKVIAYANNSRHKKAIEILGRVDDEKRLELMSDSSVIVVTSVKEGWGLIITEAASQGTPAVAYNTDGLRDSLINQRTGFLAKSGDPRLLGAMIDKTVSDNEEYNQLRLNAWNFSKQFTDKNLYLDFCKGIGLHNE